MSERDTAQRVWRDLEPHLAEQGYELVEVEYVPRGHRSLLRVFIDKQGGITLADCQAASQVAGAVLDKLESIGESYLLEMSSPGIDRPIRKALDFGRFVGEPVRMKTIAPVEGRKNFRGVLKDFVEDMASVECDGRVYRIALSNLHKANLDR